MSRGPGRLQRWLIANLPDAPPGHLDHVAQSRALAATFYATAAPTEAQVAAVRRALCGLADKGLVQRWRPRIATHGTPSFWTRLACGAAVAGRPTTGSGSPDAG